MAWHVASGEPSSSSARRDRLIGDVADQRVLEAVAAVPAMMDEVALDEVAEAAGRPAAVAVEQRLELLEREAAADHRGPLEETLVGRIEQVEAGRDHTLHGLGHPVAAALAADRQDLLEEERVPARQVDRARRRLTGRRERGG